MPLGVYIHFPFCRAICPYCDFAVAARRELPHRAYADALLGELEARAALYEGRALGSVYFGGGTPSLWAPEQVARVLEAVRRRLGGPPVDELEVTLEANPDDLPDDRLVALRRLGVNRLSLGVQSLDDGLLGALGRLHSGAEARAAVARARAAGFANVSIDLMFALPGQDEARLEACLDGLLALGPDHASLYGLTIEERTPMAAWVAQGRVAVPDGDVAARLYERARERLEAGGLEQYEISSYARPGRRSRHNQLYWTGGEWLGLGVSAASQRLVDAGEGRLAAERATNTRSIDGYLSGAAADLVVERQALDPTALAADELWLGLRVRDGIDRAAFARRHGRDPVVALGARLEPLVRAGWVELAAGRLRLTRRGVLVADEVAVRLLP